MSDFVPIIGTRGSDLALWQANHVKSLLDVASELKIIKTSGDRLLNESLQGRLEKGFFTSELEEALQKNEIDLAVHSLKDLPTEFPDDLDVGAYLKRGPLSDILIINPDFHVPGSFFPVKEGCIVGSSSLRRQALMKVFSPSAKTELLRGNVPTRLRKLAEGRYGAIILARAGVERLGLDVSGFVVYELDPKLWLPAPGQGNVAVEIRKNDLRTRALLAKLHDADSAQAVIIERTLMSRFEGGCHAAFGAHARRQGNEWIVTLGIERDGVWLQKIVSGSPEQCMAFGPDRIDEMEAFNLSRRL